MGSYGFRLFTFKISKGMARKDHPLVQEVKDKADWEYRSHILAAATERLKEAVHGLPPRLDGQPRVRTDEQPVMQLINCKLHAGHLVGTIRHGRPSGHDLALPKESLGAVDPIDISDYAPTREYRFALLFPTLGDEGVLVVESVSGSCPSRFLVQWMRRWSQQYVEEQNPVDPGPWYKLKAFVMGDSAQLKAFLEKSKLEEIVLVSRKTGASRMRRDEEFRITSTLEVQGKKRALDKLATAVKAKKSDEELARDLASMLGADVEALDLDDAWIALQTEYGRQLVSPSRLPDVFTYPIGEKKPDDSDFRTEVKERVQALESIVDGTLGFNGW